MIRKTLEIIWFFTGGMILFLAAFSLLEIVSFLRKILDIKFGELKRRP